MLVPMRLHAYLKSNSITADEFAQRIGASASGVRKWLYEDRTPRPEMMRKIHEATGGQVTAIDLTGSAPAPENEDAQDEVAE